MKVWLYSIMWNEAQMLPWFLRHYAPWVDKIVVFLEKSDDGSEWLLRSCPKVDLRVWPFKGLDDEAFLEMVNECYKEARGKADWVAHVDADELLYHPHMPELLSNKHADVIQAKGYALISEVGWPHDDGHSQLYDLVKTGAPQWNYDKKLLFRPSLDFHHTIGRHTYENKFPRHNGREWTNSGLKLLHCHHVGGITHTADRNRRNYDRAIDKKFAWNMTDAHNKKEQVGTVAWVRDLIVSGKLEAVV